MFDICVTRAIQALVDYAFQEWRKGEGLYIRVACAVQHPEYFNIQYNVSPKRKLRSRETAHFLFMGESNYKRVFYNDTRGREDLFRFPRKEEWQDLSHHDSCWRGDGFREFDDLYFKMCHKVAGEEKIDPKSMVTPVFIEEVWDVRVKLEPQPEEYQVFGRTRYWPVVSEKRGV